jgi:hypothetical protein
MAVESRRGETRAATAIVLTLTLAVEGNQESWSTLSLFKEHVLLGISRIYNTRLYHQTYLVMPWLGF